MKRAGLLLLLVALLAPTGAQAQSGLQATARVMEPDAGVSYTVGTPIIVEIQARHALGGVALLPDPLGLPAALGERKRLRRHERRREGALDVDVYRLELVPFMPGLVEIPPLPLAVGSTVAETEPLLVEVASTLDEAELEVASSTRAENMAMLENMAAGDPPGASVEIADPRPAIGLIALVALLLAGLFARRLLSRRRERAEAPAPAPPPRAAHEVALEALRELEGSDLVERGEFNAFFTELSFLVRRYLGDRFGFDAVERTLDELDEALQARSTPGLDRRELSALLVEAEQVKFAKYTPRVDDAEAGVERARAMIEATQLRPPAPPEAPEGQP